MYITAQAAVSEMTYTVSSGTLNSSIPYHTLSYDILLAPLDNL